MLKLTAEDIVKIVLDPTNTIDERQQVEVTNTDLRKALVLMSSQEELDETLNTWLNSTDEEKKDFINYVLNENNTPLEQYDKENN